MTQTYEWSIERIAAHDNALISKRQMAIVHSGLRPGLLQKGTGNGNTAGSQYRNARALKMSLLQKEDTPNS